VGDSAANSLHDLQAVLEQAVQVKNVWVPYGV
jgi:aldehyde dehydrogenase (NAD+)